MLVIVENWNVEPLLKPPLYFKTARRGDIFEVDAAKRDGDLGYDVHKFVYVFGGDRERHRIYAGKALE